MNELALVRAIARWTAGKAPGLITGIGDDCAVIRPNAREDLLVTTDLLLEDVHFRRASHTAPDIGWRAMARGLSDIAAMGGQPRFALLSLALAPWTCQSFLADFFRGARELASRHGVQVIGGDLTRGAQFTCDVVVLGAVPRGKALLRDGARPGDVIYVSGPLGAAAASGWRHRPQPRVELGQLLRRKVKPSACMDLSDGLLLDLHRMCVASNVAARIDSDAIPVALGATLEQALSGGEDYELLFTAGPRARIPAGVTRIGVIAAGKPGQIFLDGRRVEPRGWDPFATQPKKSV